MKYIDIIKTESKINFDSNDFQVNKVVKNVEKSSVLIDVTFSHVLGINEYKDFYDLNKHIFIDKCNFKSFIIDLKYKDYTIENSEALAYIHYAINSLVAERPSFSSFSGLNISFNKDTYIFGVDKDSLFLEAQDKPLLDKLAEYGLHYNIKFEVDPSLQSLSSLKEEETKNFINEINSRPKTVVVKEENKEKTKKFYNSRQKIEVTDITQIKDIPFDQGSLLTYQEQNGLPHFRIQGQIFKMDVAKKKISYLVKLSIYDGTDSIVCNKWANEEEVKQINEWKNGDVLDIVGKAEYSPFERDVVIQIDHMSLIGSTKKASREDSQEKKYVELMVHTKMCNLDGLNSADEYVKQGLKFGMHRMGFSDLSGLYYIPDILHHWPKGEEFHPIYGVELPFIDDLAYSITLTNGDYDLRSATYVVFDIETTGLSQKYDTIIEISCMKVRSGAIIEKLDSFVNPRRSIPEFISDKTHITDDMVADAPFIEEVLPKFMEFAKGCILVGHNVQFDTGMIYEEMRRLGIPKIEYPAIDTANLFRAYCNPDVDPERGVKKFNLEVLAKYFKVREDQHHRANDDTRVTEECFVQMLGDMYKRGIYNYKDINKLIDPSNFYKYVIPSTINIIAKNQVGFKNLYKLLSDSLTIHCFGDARLLKSILNRFREGLLVYEGNYRSNIFEWAMNRSEEEVIEEMNYLDFVTVLPPSAYYHLATDVPNGEQRIKENILRIITLAKKAGKDVLGQCCPYYIDPDDKKYRDILIASPQIGGGLSRLAYYKDSPFAHFRTTDEMLSEFEFIGKQEAYDIVVENTNKIADLVEDINVFPKDNKETGEQAMKAPVDDQFSESLGVPSIVEDMKRIVYSNLDKLYGHEHVHPIVQKRLDREMNSIIGAGYSSTYYMAHLMVHKSVEDGYMVGSRGSVGSSFVATMMDITEINPLPPHYRCPQCKFHVFKMTDDEKKEYGVSDLEKPFMADLDNILSGYDLPDAVCPCCGTPLVKDGHDIPFETFLGFNGDKVPDIDLNFSSEYQSRAHAFIKEVFGVTHSFRAGTLATIADKNAFGYVKAYAEKKNLHLRACEIDRIASKIIGVKRSTGQHPGGIVVVPKYFDIFSVTPIQYASNNTDNEWMTTHYDYHSFEENLLKLDCLGHDDPTMIRYFMDYVNNHQEKYKFTIAQEIPIDDHKVYQMFGGTSVLNLDENVIKSKVASFAVPEFGTTFVRQMLNDTMPNTFAQLVKISGLSHGTNVWLNNAQALVLGTSVNGKIPFADVIGCRDDVMLDLINMGCDPSQSFQIMEFVRKNKKVKDPKKWEDYKAYMREKKVPEWYIWSCERIEYLFPKAHATAYVLMALRIAWFKMYSPALFYSGWLSKRAKAYDIETFPKSVEMITQKIDMVSSKKDKTAKDDDVVTALEVVREARARGIKFLPIDINKSEAKIFTVVDDDTLRIPFVAVDGLGESAAISIETARNEKPFTSIDDVMKRTRLSKTLCEYFKTIHAFGDLPEHDEEKLVGLFNFM
ncbi:MAG: PolC-type DNA polymerase III [Acholeplasmatales bacterium]|nr:PolC-type DNA polymerase III [Acholeplasmatales bacterium]